MATYSWAAPISGDWISASDWSPAVVPNDPTANVSIDNPTLAPYIVTIGAGEFWTVNSLSMNAAYDLAGSNTTAYTAAALSINGTLNFASGSAGSLGGSLQTQVFMNNGTILNPGTINAFIQGQGNDLLTGTNGIYITNWLQSAGGVMTIDTKSIAEMSGTTLFDGIFEAQGIGGVVNLGGPRQNLVVNIATIEGPPAIAAGWTELILNGATTEIGEWNGAGYVGIESTLTGIAARGTLDVLGGRNYITPNALTIQPTGLLNLRAGTVSTPLLDINGGTVQGSGDVTGGIINNGTLRALDGLLSTGSGGLVGTGIVTFDYDQQAGTVAATGATMQVFGVGAGQTFIMNGDDSLVISTPVSFAGTLDTKVGDKIFVGGVAATSAVVQGNSLLLESNGTPVYVLHLNAADAGGTYTTTAFGGTSTEITMTGSAAATASDAVASDSSISLTGSISTLNITDVTNNTSLTVPSGLYTGTLSGVLNNLATITPTTLNGTLGVQNVFISTATTGTNSINASQATGNTVLASAGGSSFMTGNAADDAFIVGPNGQTTDTLSTLAGFHSGDVAVLLGVSASDFTVSLANDVGAPGYTGLDFTFSAAGQPSTGIVLPGYSISDLLPGGRLSQSFGTADGVSYLKVQAA